VGKIQMLRDALGVVDVIERAAAVLGGAVTLEFGEAALIPELHSEADDGAVLLEEDGGDGRGVDTTGHSYGDEAGSGFGGWRRRKGVELEPRGHVGSILAVLVSFCWGRRDLTQRALRAAHGERRDRADQEIAADFW
jgi:hypothetical protein